MAELTPTPWTSTQASAQYRAIIWLRWRMLATGFRRKGGKGELIAWIIILPLFFAVLAGLCFGAAALCYLGVVKQQFLLVTGVAWAIFVVSQLVNINIGSPGTTFDPTQLIRFPLSVQRYTLIRLFFGILAPGNIIVAFLSLAAAIGVSIAAPRLSAYALIAFAVFALVNVLFTRMVFSWVDRWLSTRRAREVFTAIIFIASLGFQWFNMQYNMGSTHHRHARHHAAAEDEETGAPLSPHMQRALGWWNAARPALRLLPPGLVADSIANSNADKPAAFAGEMLGLAAYAATFFAIFGLRMRIEFRGESLSDQANAVSKPKEAPRQPPGASASLSTLNEPVTAHAQTVNAVRAMLGKEFLYLRRNTGILYGLIAPLVMVFLFAGRMATRSNSEWVFPGALAYALLGVVPVSYNAFGLDGTGAQMYFLAPIRVRDVLLAKNILNSLLAGIEIVAILCMIGYVAGLPSAIMVVSAILWAAMTLLVEVTVGNYRSINTPKKVDLQKTAQKQASPLSALLSMGILLVSAAVGWSLMMLAEVSGFAWLLPLVLAAMAAVAAYVYWHNLERMDNYALLHRDALFEELGKKA